MKPHLNALMNALVASTNPYQLERPCYMLWNHLFVSLSNSTQKNHLWTSPEFPIVVPVGDNEVFDSTYYDEDEDESEASDSDTSDGVPDNSIMDDSFFLKAQRELADSPKNPTIGSGGSNQVSPIDPHQINPWYKIRTRGRLLNPGNPSTIFQERVPTASAANVPVSDTSISTTTPDQNQQDGTTVAESHTSSERRSRIVDFAVSYLIIDDKSELSKYLHFQLQNFELVKLPIVVEGKRPPGNEYDENSSKFRKQLKRFMNLAYKDFYKKRAFVFEVYSCLSFIAIAFSGPYWSFAVCRSSFAPLVWSKIISVQSRHHNTTLRKIFQAAEADPNDPGSDEGIGKLVTKYRQGESFEIVL